MGGHFGASVSVLERFALIGASGVDTPAHVNTGAAFLFMADGSNGDSWPLKEAFYASDRLSGDRFGFSVNLASTSSFVGAPDATAVNNNTGKVYQFFRKPTASSVTAIDYFIE